MFDPKQLIFIVACFATAVSAAATKDLYEPLEQTVEPDLEAPDGGPGFRKAIAATVWPNQPVLLEGWISPFIWTRLYADRQMFLVQRRPPLARDHHLCRVTVFDPLVPGYNADASAGIARLDWGCTTKHETDARGYSTLRLHPRSAPRPTVVDKMQASTADGLLLKIEHITDVGMWSPPLPPTVEMKHLVYGRLPVGRSRAGDGAHTAYFVRAGGPGQPARWGVAFKFGASGTKVARSGCFIEPVDRLTAVPSETWLTPAVVQWCRARQEIWIAAQPPQPAPILPPLPEIAPAADQPKR